MTSNNDNKIAKDAAIIVSSTNIRNTLPLAYRSTMVVTIMQRSFLLQQCTVNALE